MAESFYGEARTEGGGLPKGWRKTTVGEFCPFLYGKGLRKKLRDTSGQVPVFGSNGVVSMHSSAYVCGPGVIIGRKGSIGSVTFSKEPFWPIDTTFYITAGNHRDLRYTFYLLKSIGLEYMNSDSAVPGLNRNAAHSRKIVIPPLLEQRRIAEVLGSLDDKIELNRRMSQTLEAISQATFKSWFVDFDPVIDNALVAGNEIPMALQSRASRRASGDRSLPPAIQRLFPSEFESSAQGPIPKGWKITTVENAVEINPPIKLKKGLVAPYVDMKALPTKGYSANGVIMKSYSGGSKFQKGDVLMARITPCLENGKTAIVDFLEGDQVGFGSTEFIVLRGKGLIGMPFVACLSRNQKFRDHCAQSMVGTSGRQRVQNSCFSDFYLALPDNKKLLEKYHSLGIENFEQMTAYGRQTESLSGLRDVLLPRLLSGKVSLRESGV